MGKCYNDSIEIQVYFEKVLICHFYSLGIALV